MTTAKKQEPAKPVREAASARDIAAPVTKPTNLTMLEGLLDVDNRRKPELKKSRSGWRRKLRARHIVIAAAFLAVVALPTVLASTYMFFVASDQYHSSSSFSVRSIEATSGSDILGMFTQSAASSTVSDSYVLLDYIRSEKMMQDVGKQLDLDTIFARRGGDFYFGLAPGLPVEDKVDYWHNMVSVNFDHASGILNLQVKAFDPQSAQAISGVVIAQSETLINDLSLKARNGILLTAQEEVRLAEARLAAARISIRNFRDTSQEADPVEGARLATQLIANLEQQLVQLNADLSTAQSQMSAESPRIRVMKTRIDSLEKQIEQERQRFGSGDLNAAANSDDGNADVAGRILQYETLETEREFAERAYTGALGSLEKARIDANGQQRYLAVFITPTLSELAQYPHRAFSALLVFLGALFVWGVCVMGYYNIRDRN